MKGRQWVVVAVLASAALVVAGCSVGSGVPIPGATGADGAPVTDAVSPAANQPGGIAHVTVPAAPGTTATTASPSPDTSPSEPAPPPVPAARLTLTPTSGSDTLDPIAAVTAAVSGGTLTAVTLVNPAEKLAVKGTLNSARTAWRSTEVLGYGKTYRLTATGKNSAGATVTSTSTFTTLTPQNQTMPSLDYIGGYPLTNGATYGVGIVPVVHFDEPIADKAAAQRALHVTTTPTVAGVWYWADDQDVHFRPQTFWPAGTKVTVTADLYGVQVGPGLYGQSDVSTSFTIGRKQLTVAYDNSPQVDKVLVYDAAGQVIRSMNTSMGEHGGETWNGNYINFYTMGGTYTVLAHTNPEMMSSASYGLPANAPGGYAPEPIYYSTRISIDGIFLHELDNTVWAQDSGADVSHGCLNLSHDNAVWYYDHSIIGDPVIIHGATGAPEIQLSQGGDWSVPWSTWVAGSAVH